MKFKSTSKHSIPLEQAARAKLLSGKLTSSSITSVARKLMGHTLKMPTAPPNKERG